MRPVVYRLCAATLATLAGGLLLTGVGAQAAETLRELPATALSTPTTATRPVDARGFIHRWMVLEPISVPGQLTEGPVKATLEGAQLPGSPTAVPRDGDVVDHNGPLRWHAVDTEDYNLNLYHFAWRLSKPTSNVLFWVVTMVDAPAEMHDVRLAIGSNAASQWWLNGQSVITLYNDRQTVIDDGVSKRVTLKKGRNVIRAAIINAGGATDFCARFLDANDKPVAGLTVTLAD
jgi:hypothetical protein